MASPGFWVHGGHDQRLANIKIFANSKYCVRIFLKHNRTLTSSTWPTCSTFCSQILSVCMYVCILHLLRINTSCKWDGKSFICANRRCEKRAADNIQKAAYCCYWQNSCEPTVYQPSQFLELRKENFDSAFKFRGISRGPVPPHI